MVHNGIRVINESQLIKNLEEIRKIIGKDKKICAMVKADAYGHGIKKISELLLNKIDFLGVANINEALLIRNLNKNIKILIVGKTYSFEDCLNNDISFIIDSLNHFKILLKFIKNYDTKDMCINIHLKINSGMNRLGINSIEEFKEIYYTAKANGIKIEGVSTHFATADCDKQMFQKQLKIFNIFLREIPKDENPIIHIGGSPCWIRTNDLSVNSRVLHR